MAAQAKKERILIVEDELTMLNALADKLIREGFVVLEEKNGEEGLKTALSKHPDLILLDIVMPVMDGVTMLKKLREEDSWGEHVPVIMLTNLNESKSISDSMNENIANYLIKSDWKLEDIVKTIREKLDTSSN